MLEPTRRATGNSLRRNITEPTTSPSKNNLRRAIGPENRVKSLDKMLDASDYNAELWEGQEIPLSPQVIERLSTCNERLDKYLEDRKLSKVMEIEESLLNKANSVEEYHHLIEEKCEVLRNNSDKCVRDGTDDLLTADPVFVAKLESLVENGATDEALIQHFCIVQDRAVDNYLF